MSKASKPDTPAAAPSALSLAYEGKLPQILRLIADEIDAGRALEETFTAQVTRGGDFQLSARITILHQQH